MINRLITFGDSFTYGEELENPQRDCWPQLVANHLKISLKNKAFPANSNDYILEQVLYEDYSFKDLVIICFSSISRFYFEDHDGWYTTIPTIQNGNLIRGEITKNLHSSLTEKWLFRRFLIQAIYLQEFLQSRQVNHLFVNAFESYDVNLAKLKNFRHLTEMLDKNKFIGWPDQSFGSLTNHLPRGKFKHPIEESHLLFSQIVNEKVREIYNLPKIKKTS
jgi:hypothetical protein